MISDISRYETVPVIRVPVAGGALIPTVYAPEFERRPSVFEFDLYAIKEGDRLDVLAHRFFGDASLWWVIAGANPEIGFPDDIAPGHQVRIPRAG